MFRDYLGHSVHDGREREVSTEKSVHRFLVGRVVDRRGGTPCLPDLGGQSHGGKHLVVERFEGPILCTGPVQGGPCLRSEERRGGRGGRAARASCEEGATSG